MPTSPLPVTDVRDTWEWVIVWCTVGAAALAAIAIVIAVIAVRRTDRIARKTEEAAVRERRNVFELGVLVQVLETCGLSPPGAGNVLQGLLAMLPADELPGIRAKSARGLVPSNNDLTGFMLEYLEAVGRRLRSGEITEAPQAGRRRLRARLPRCRRKHDG